MAQIADTNTTDVLGTTHSSSEANKAKVDWSNPLYQAYQVLHIGFAVAPIAFGLDKFFHIMTNWDQYLAPLVNNLLGGHGHEFMLVVGVIEIIAGIGVALKPRYFAYVVSLWLLGICGNILLAGNFFDVALRDFGLALGALALARISEVYNR